MSLSLVRGDQVRLPYFLKHVLNTKRGSEHWLIAVSVDEPTTVDLAFTHARTKDRGGKASMSPIAARELAAALVKAADRADKLSGTASA